MRMQSTIPRIGFLALMLWVGLMLAVALMRPTQRTFEAAALGFVVMSGAFVFSVAPARAGTRMRGAAGRIAMAGPVLALICVAIAFWGGASSDPWRPAPRPLAVGYLMLAGGMLFGRRGAGVRGAPGLLALTGLALATLLGPGLIASAAVILALALFFTALMALRAGPHALCAALLAAALPLAFLGLPLLAGAPDATPFGAPAADSGALGMVIRLALVSLAAGLDFAALTMWLQPRLPRVLLWFHAAALVLAAALVFAPVTLVTFLNTALPQAGLDGPAGRFFSQVLRLGNDGVSALALLVLGGGVAIWLRRSRPTSPVSSASL